MSRHGVMAMAFGGIPRNALVKVKNKAIKFKDVKVKVEDPNLYVVFMPNVDLMIMLINKISDSWGIMFVPQTGMYNVVGFQHGLMSTEDVPVFEQGKITGRRELLVKNHLIIRSSSFDDCVRRLFRAAVSGKLYDITTKGYSRLYWDRIDGSFHTELVDKGEVKCARRKT